MSSNVVVFDDDNDVVELITAALSRKGFTVHAFWELEGFITKLLELKPCIVLMDYMVPPIAGKSAARQIKTHEELARIPVIIISGVENIEEIAIKAAADDFLKKPFEMKQLEAKINRLCGTRSTKKMTARNA